MGKKAHHKLVTRGISLSLSQNCLTFLFLHPPSPSYDTRFPFPFALLPPLLTASFPMIYNSPPTTNF